MQTYLELRDLVSSCSMHLQRKEDKEASEGLWEEGARPSLLPALGMSLLPCHTGDAERGDLNTGIQHGNRAKQECETWL